MKSASATDIGLLRPENQDAERIIALGGAVFAVVCDGMGGERSGKKASKIAIEAMSQIVEKEYSPELTGEQKKKLLLNAVSEANSKVYNAALTNADDYGMGTTCVAALVTGDMLHLINIGDSRAYLYTNGLMALLTMDHTYVQMLYQRGDIGKNEIQSHPKRNMLTKAVGIEKSITADYFEFKLPESFKLLLCSDGLSGYCTSEEIKDTLAQYGDNIDAAAAALIGLANGKGGIDNVTIAIIMND